ncbi:TPA: hypothetical protein ACOFD8_002519 [Stenotrophomonas maltophilia]
MLDWSAIATASAAVIALVVGVTPLFWAKLQRARVGRAKARIAEVDLKIQALHVSAGLQLIGQDSTHAHHYRVAIRQFQVLNAESCRELVPYLDSLPSGLEAPLSDVISDIGIGTRLLDDPAPVRSSGVINTAATRDLYSELLETMNSARLALSKAIGNGYTPEPLGDEVDSMVRQLRADARADLMAEVERNQRM